MNPVLVYLSDHKIQYDLVTHEPLFTVEHAAVVLSNLPGAATKNLFLRDDKDRRHFLVTTAD
ncbi:MAG TPA: hypothetical protein PKA63_08005 [Oligoflexia bacterium]|nr:hypothetical protein [Oligoflexia bacterium]HMP48593.1 hypothetical protein [Oligoflexia bacterium]